MKSLEVIEIRNLCLDKTSLKIGMNNASSLGCQASLLDSPCSYLLDPCCEELLQV